MLNYAEVTAWSLEEVRQSLQQSLPDGWKLEQGSTEGYLWVRLLQSDGSEAWNTIHLDERNLLLAAYCWLLLRGQPVPTPDVSAWGSRRGELTMRGVTRRALNLPDPEDLDPDEIRAVYEEAARDKRR
jgi:hypothetical protein